MERLLFKNDEADSFCEQRKGLELLFQEFNQKLGYKSVNPVPIYPSVDKTTIFVGSTISTFKRELENEENLNSGICVVQPCLRTHTKDYFYNDEQVSDYSSFFHQAGTLIKAGNYERVCLESFKFLTNELNIDPSLIQVQVSSQFHEISKFWLTQFPNNTVADAHPNKYYQWTYGENGMNGLGITFSIRSEKNPKYRDIGNVIIISKDRRESAIEWGFGTETLLSRIYGLPKPQATSKICDFVKFAPGIQEKFLDTLVTSVEMYKSGVEPSRKGGAMQILKIHLKALHYLSKKLEIGNDTIRELIDKYISNCTRINISDKIIQFLQDRDRLLQRYKEDVLKVEGSCKSRGIAVEPELAKLRQLMGLDGVEII